MSVSEFNVFMKRCDDDFRVRYVTPVIHPRVKLVVAITLDMVDESVKFTITNNPDENFNLNNAVNDYLDKR